MDNSQRCKYSFFFLSETTTHEVIRALLKKFKVVDNPQKFALYERYYEQEETAKGELLYCIQYVYKIGL